MKNFVQKGRHLTYINAGSAIAAGAVVVVGKIIGIAETDIAATTGEGTLVVEGVFALAKTAGLAVAQGDKLYWNTSTSAASRTRGNARGVDLNRNWPASN